MLCLSVQDAERRYCVIALETFDAPDRYWRKIVDSGCGEVNLGRFIAPMSCGLLRIGHVSSLDRDWGDRENESSTVSAPETERQPHTCCYGITPKGPDRLKQPASLCRAIADCVVPIRVASSDCVRFAAVRARTIASTNAYSSSACAYSSRYAESYTKRSFRCLPEFAQHSTDC